MERKTVIAQTPNPAGGITKVLPLPRASVAQWRGGITKALPLQRGSTPKGGGGTIGASSRERFPTSAFCVLSSVFLLVLAACGSTAQEKYSGGSGTPEDPYRIADHNDLYALADGTNALPMKNIFHIRKFPLTTYGRNA